MADYKVWKLSEFTGGLNSFTDSRDLEPNEFAEFVDIATENSSKPLSSEIKNNELNKMVEKIEINSYFKTAYLQQISLRDFIIGFFVLDPENLKKWAEEKGLPVDDALTKNKELIETLYADLLDLAAANKFNGLEKPKQLVLLREPFSVENDMLTPSFK